MLYKSRGREEGLYVNIRLCNIIGRMKGKTRRRLDSGLGSAFDIYAMTAYPGRRYGQVRPRSVIHNFVPCLGKICIIFKLARENRKGS